jgi:hypothetical protein
MSPAAVESHTQMDFIALAGLIVGLAALGIAIYGIRDVREQVRLLIGLERNLAFSILLNKMVWRFVDPTKDTSEQTTVAEMQQYTMLARVLEPKQTLDSVQEAASKDVLWLAQELVRRGHATWKADMDEGKIREIVKSWQSEKNSEALKSMFGRRHGSIL